MAHNIVFQTLEFNLPYIITLILRQQ